MNAPITKIGSPTCNVGDIVAVPITTSGYQDVIALTLSVRYNKNFLQYIDTVVADEFKVGGPFNDGILINDYQLAGNADFRCIAAAWYKIGGKGIAQVPDETVMYHRFKALTPASANLVFVDKTIKNPQTVCEWGAVEADENGNIINLYAMPEPTGTYVGGTITIEPK